MSATDLPRILLVIGQASGGAGVHVQQLAHDLLARGWPVRVAAPTGVLHQFGLDRPALAAVDVPIGPRPSPVADARAVHLLARAMGASDLVHAHGVRAAALAALARRRPPRAPGVPLVASLHNAAPTGRAQRLIFDALGRVVAREAALVLGVSTDVEQQARAWGARSVQQAVIAAPWHHHPVRDPQAVRAEFGDPQILITSVGRLTEQKDPFTLLAAIEHAALPHDTLIVLAGDGPLHHALHQHITDRRLPVRLLGRRADVADLLAASDLVVSSARWEGQPLWLQEALQAGAAIVATDAGGTAQVLGGAGELVPVGQVHPLAQALGELAHDQPRRAALAAAARRRAAALPSLAQATDAAIQAYHEVLGAPGSAAERDSHNLT